MTRHQPTQYNSFNVSSLVSIGNANTDASGGAQIEVPIATTTAAPKATIPAPITTTGKPNVNNGTKKDASDDGVADGNTGATTTTREPDVKNLADDNTGATTTRKPDAINETDLVLKDGARTNLTAGNKTNSTVTAVVTLDGDYDSIVGNRKEKFLSECSQALSPGVCRHQL